jgi:hypothetical protein
VGPLHAQRREELRDECDLRVDPGRRAGRRHRGCAEPGQIQRDDIVVHRQAPDDRLPHLPSAADAMQEHEGLAIACPTVVELHGLPTYPMRLHEGAIAMDVRIGQAPERDPAQSSN